MQRKVRNGGRGVLREARRKRMFQETRIPQHLCHDMKRNGELLPNVRGQRGQRVHMPTRARGSSGRGAESDRRARLITRSQERPPAGTRRVALILAITGVGAMSRIQGRRAAALFRTVTWEGRSPPQNNQVVGGQEDPAL